MIVLITQKSIRLGHTTWFRKIFFSCFFNFEKCNLLKVNQANASTFSSHGFFLDSLDQQRDFHILSCHLRLS